MIAVFNNSSLDFVAQEMKADRLLPSFTSLDNPDFSKVAQSIGIHGVRIEKVGELESKLREALSYEGAVVIDVMVDGLSMLIPRK